MNKPFAVIALIVSFSLLIFRVTRCMKKVDRLQKSEAQTAYFEACQKKLDSAWIYFKPVATALEANQTISEATLTTTTSHLYDITSDANRIVEYDDEGGYYKKYVADFIELERGLTCCYIKKYQEEIAKNKKLSKGTSVNLLNWIDKFAAYNNVYGNAVFELYNHSDLTKFREAVQAASPQL
jgi:predicted Rdx family selenoprotein